MNVRAEDQLPDRVQTLRPADGIAYAGATWDWFVTHFDATAAALSDSPAPIVDGQMLGALLAAHAQDGLGFGARVVGMSFRHRAPVYQGDTVRVVGRIVDKSESSGALVATVQQDVHVLGIDERIAIEGATTRVLLTPPRDE